MRSATGDATGRDGTADDAAKARPQEPWCRCVRYDAGERRGVIELHLTPATLAELVAHPQRAPGYAPTSPGRSSATPSTTRRVNGPK